MATEPAITEPTSPEAGKTHRKKRLRAFAITYLSFLLITGIAAVSLGYWGREHLTSSLQDEITRNLTQKAQMLANRINADHSHGLDVIASQEGQAAGARATIIDNNGNTVADSEVLASSLGNEGARPEFKTALHGGIGVETRSHNGIQVLFVAVPVSGGAARLAYPLSDIEAASKSETERVLIGWIIAALVGFIISGAAAKAMPG